MSKVEIELTAKEQQMVQAWKRGQRSIEAFNKELDKVGGKTKKNQQQGDRFFKSVDSGISQAISRFSGFAGIVAGIGAAATMVKSEYDDLLRRQKQAAAATMTAAVATRNARQNFTADATLADKDLESTIQRVAKKTRSPVGAVASALSSAFSAKGSLSNEAAVDAVTQALRVNPGDAAAASTMAGRSLDIQKASGIGDSRQVLGFLQNLGQASRVVDPTKLGQTAVPAITSLLSRGDNVEQAGELFATFTSLMNDEEGTKTSTLVTSLGNQLAKYVPTARGKDKRGSFRVPESQREAYDGAASTTERIGILQQNAELRRAFLGQASFEAAGQAPVEKLLAGEAKAVAELRKARQNVLPLNANSAKAFETKVAGLDAGKFQSVKTLDDKTTTSVEGFQLGSGQSEAGQSRKSLQETLAQVDLPGIDYIPGIGLGQRARLMGAFETGQAIDGKSPAESAAAVLRRQLPEANPNDPLNFYKGTIDPKVEELFRNQARAFDEFAQAMRAQQQQPPQQGQPIHVNVRVQAPAGPPPKARGAAALGVQGG